mmetsp:Transcript_65740/g.132319  ORF Transcript_65740/g.132319 Transcript_65740/m.132319 type:complete len:147 (+) Transcript_65740:210-650(+)
MLAYAHICRAVPNPAGPWPVLVRVRLPMAPSSPHVKERIEAGAVQYQPEVAATPFMEVIFRWLSHGHDGKGLSLDSRDALQFAHLSQELFFRGKTCSFPVAELRGIHRGDDLVVEAATTHNTLHTLNPINCLDLAQGCINDLLDLS